MHSLNSYEVLTIITTSIEVNKQVLFLQHIILRKTSGSIRQQFNRNKVSQTGCKRCTSVQLPKPAADLYKNPISFLLTFADLIVREWSLFNNNRVCLCESIYAHFFTAHSIFVERREFIKGSNIFWALPLNDSKAPHIKFFFANPQIH